MDAAPPDFRLLQFSSDELPGTDRLELWRDMITRKLLRLAIDPLDDGPFTAVATLRSQHGVAIGSGTVSASVNHRTKQIVAADNDDFILLANAGGPFIVRYGDEEFELAPGDATLVSCTEVANFVRPTAGDVLAARLPRSALTLFLAEPDDFTGRVIHRESEALQMLLAYSGPLARMAGLTAPPEVSRSVVNHVCDLVALTLGATGEAARMAAGRGLRAARLRALKACIEEGLGSGALSVDDVAAQMKVSPRYVRKLLESENTSFSRYVVERRLERARDLLASPRHAAYPISAIAYEVGFGDLSYFNRAFRRRFDRSPSDVRAGHG
jgi:AraC-like DNA-binding protein